MEDAQKWVFVPNRVNHYEFERPLKILYHNASLFSSPTGVHHYESYQVKLVGASFGVFVPNRGLTIMNVVNYDYWTHMFVFPSPTRVTHYELTCARIMPEDLKICFRPLQGLTIMNARLMSGFLTISMGFRPQQGLTIMNRSTKHRHYLTRSRFPSPTGVNHYEFKTEKFQH